MSFLLLFSSTHFFSPSYLLYIFVPSSSHPQLSLLLSFTVTTVVCRLRISSARTLEVPLLHLSFETNKPWQTTGTQTTDTTKKKTKGSSPRRTVGQSFSHTLMRTYPSSLCRVNKSPSCKLRLLLSMNLFRIRYRN